MVRVVKEVVSHRVQIEFRNLDPDAEIVAYHDAALYNSVGVEIHEREEGDLLQTGLDKKLVHSQKGAIIGFIKRWQTAQSEKVHRNVVDWRSATNKHVVESSFAAETHAAIMAQGMASFSQVLSSHV